MTRTYVITGSASGIGATLTRRLRDEGHRVVGVDLAGAEITADLSTPAGREAMVAAVAGATDGVVDAVVANAGVSVPGALSVRVNHFGAVATLEGLRPLLARGEDPRAAATCSVAALGPYDAGLVDACLTGDEEAAADLADGLDLLTYGSSKRALARWIRAHAATESWAGAGIPLNAVGPGIVETPMTAPLLATEEGRALADGAVPMPLHGHADPGHVASLLAWLTSPDNAVMCGQIIFLDGGAEVVQRGDEAF